MLNPIEEYLREQKGAGRSDSTGTFTIAADKAAVKLAEFQLPRPSAWILKMVQAGVAAGCTAIDVYQNAKGCEVVYHGGTLGRAQELVNLCIDPQAKTTTAQEHLLVGLRSVALSGRRPVLIIDESVDGAPLSSLWDEGHISAPEPLGFLGRALRARGEGTLSFHVGASSLSQERLLSRDKGVRDATARVYRELITNAVTCPIPLKVDGRRLDYFGLQDASFHRSPILFGGQPRNIGQPGFAVSLTVLPHGAIEKSYSVAWTAYLLKHTQANEVCWVKDGVICESSTFGGERKFYLRLFLPASDLKTDLTGLHLRFPSDDQREERILKGLEAFIKSSPEMKSKQAMPFRDVHGQRNAKNWVTSTVLTVGGALLLPLTGVGAFALGALGALGYKYAGKEDQQVYEEEIKRDFIKWAPSLKRTYLDRQSFHDR